MAPCGQITLHARKYSEGLPSKLSKDWEVIESQYIVRRKKKLLNTSINPDELHSNKLGKILSILEAEPKLPDAYKKNRRNIYRVSTRLQVLQNMLKLDHQNTTD